jgi:hypothetical protein
MSYVDVLSGQISGVNMSEFLIEVRIQTEFRNIVMLMLHLSH